MPNLLRKLMLGITMSLLATLSAQAEMTAPADNGTGDVAFMAPLTNVPADLALMKRKKIPMLLFFHASYCAYCKEVDSEFIQPMADDPKYQGKLIIRRVMVDADTRFIGHDGKKHDYLYLTHRFDVTLVPVVMFIGPDGRQIGEQLRGITVPDFYPYYLNQGIDLAEHCAKSPDDPTCKPKGKLKFPSNPQRKL